MKRAGQIVLFNFPQTDLVRGKLRPALLINKLPGPYDDWLICMISSQTSQHIEGFDEIVRESDADFGRSGLKVAGVIRVGRLAVVEGRMLIGSIGEIESERLQRLKSNLARWLTQTEEEERADDTQPT
jgi:mRNA interferase MazF